MNGIRRKLRSQRGVTVVFALVIFLIMALFSYVMVNASLTAVQGAHASRVDEQAALSVASASRVLQGKIQTELTNNKIRYNVADSQWRLVDSFDTYSWLQYILEALNENPQNNLSLNVSNPSRTDITDAIGEVKVSIKAEDNTSRTDIPFHPCLILNFSFLKDGTVLYYSNTVITLGVAPDGTIDSVTNTVSTLGQYEVS